MKLRVLAHSLTGPRISSLVTGALVGLIAGVFSLRFIATGGPTIAAVVILVWTVGWLVGPILMGGGDETLRPENFALLPLSPIRLAFGLLGASIAGVPPVATAIAFLGLAVGATGVVPTVVAVIAAVLTLAFTVLLSRVLISMIGTVLSSRRGKDLGVLLAALAGLSYVPLRYAAQAVTPVLTQGPSGLTNTLLWLPTGWGPTAIKAATTGNWTIVAGALLALAIVDGALLWFWGRLLARRLITRPVNTVPARRSKASRRTAKTPVGAVIGKELRMWWRDARRRTFLLTSVLIGLIFPAFMGSGGLLPFAALWMVGFSVLQLSNLYGYDGTSVWHTIVTPGAARADVRGRQWAWTLIVGPIAILAAAILPGATGQAWAYPWVLGLLPALIGTAAGFIVLLSVYWPYPMPQGENPFALGNNTRPGFSRAAVRFLSVAILAVGAVPSLILLLVGAGWFAVPVGVVTGALAAWQLGRLAEQRLLARGPELLARLGS
jgi:ABC-2 type transport system permease protein